MALTPKAARVLTAETGIGAETLAKLLYEWDPHRSQRRLPATGGHDGRGRRERDGGHRQSPSVHRTGPVPGLATELVGDPSQLQAVGRGGTFAELCRIARSGELTMLHRFTQRWEATATLQLRAGRAAALDAYVDHGRVSAGGVDEAPMPSPTPGQSTSPPDRAWR